MTQINDKLPNSGGSASSLTNTHTDERLMVSVRVRPLQDPLEGSCIQVVSNRTLLFDDGSKNKPKPYNYDYVFGEKAAQEHVYQTTTAPLVNDVLNGYNAAVFAYGATGSGKTHTMLGPNPKKAATPTSKDMNPNEIKISEKNNGLMIKAIQDIFKHIEESKRPDSYKITISYLEIYNELIKDLLNPGPPLELREDKCGNQIVSGLTEITTTSRFEFIAFLLKGNIARTVEPTAANETSSRSHALLSITVRHKIKEGIKQGRLFLTDLAGSERARKTKNRGKRLQEGAHINRSLLALGNCINALAAGARYVNYRDSKLTRLLKDALSGKCKTVMIAHVAPETSFRDESKNTLLYADRANHITTRLQNPLIIAENPEYPLEHYQSLITELREEVSRLKSKIQVDRPRSAAIISRTEALLTANDEERKRAEDQKKQELKFLQEQIVTTFKNQMSLRRRLLDADSHLLGLELDAERQHMVISHWQSRQGKLYEKFEKEEVDESDSEGTSAVRAAWSELGSIEKEALRYKEIRDQIEKDLEECRKKGVDLEDELPERISSDEERELLSLLCRVHELEADKVSLQAERMARQAEMRRRDLQLLRAERQRRICEDIISTQRRLIEDGQMELTEDLKELYALYQQEIHASTYVQQPLPTANRELLETKLPPIYASSQAVGSPGSSSGSEWSPSPLPPIESDANNNVVHNKKNNKSKSNSPTNPDRLMGAPVQVAPKKLPSLGRFRKNVSRIGRHSTSSED